jgi:hypothetical protein
MFYQTNIEISMLFLKIKAPFPIQLHDYKIKAPFPINF